ncbi:hypothetical protein D3C72_1872060 [compost metagenome]
MARAFLHLAAQHQHHQACQQTENGQRSEAPPQQRGHLDGGLLRPPAAQNASVRRVCPTAPVLHRPVNGRQHVCVAPRARGKEQHGRLKHDARISHAIPCGVKVAKQVVGDHRVGLAPLHQRESVHQAGRIHHAGLNAKTVQHVDEGSALHRAPQHRDPFALQVKQ